MDPQTVQVDVAMTEADRLPMLTISSQSSFVLSATPPSDASFNVASLSSTPPTSVSPDNVSLASDQDVPTPKAMAVSCRILDEPEPQSLLSLGPEGTKELHLEQQPERESERQIERELKAESEHPREEPLASLPPLDEASPKQKPESRSEPLTETTTEASSELDVQAQLERQLGCETELRAESNPESELEAPDVQPPTERAPEEAAEKEAGQQTEQQAELHVEQQPVSGTKRQLQSEPAIEPSAGRQLPEPTAIVVATENPAPPAETPSPKRPRRARASLPTYNLSKLFGTDIHGRRASKGDDVKSHKRRRTAVGLAPAANNVTASAPTEDDSHVDAALAEALGEAISALDALKPSPTPPRSRHATKSRLESKKEEPQAKIEIATRRATRLSGASVPSAVVLPLTSLRKRGKKAVEAGLSRCKRELMRLQDTKEFAHVDEGPTITTVWSNGKFIDPRTLEEPAEGTRASQRVKTSHATEAEEEAEKAKAEEAAITNALPEVLPEPRKRTTKIWLDKGLYAGQKAPVDASACLTTQEKKKLVQVPELTKHSEKANKTLPAPMFNGLRLLLNGRDFQLPYDICNPLPPGHPKPPTYRTLTKNRFVGEAGQYWKKQKHMDDLPSKCVCKPEDGCAEDCQNRIMLYECDDTNCNVGKEQCGNRPFATLTERTQQGGRYRVGVEVFKTGDRGFGVRSNRCFRPHQIIMEYTGEIITEDECLHRMDTVYENNECYYLMSFASNIVIDATTGSIARFVNHSCSPNCRMIKWIVSGQPRMALFAGDRPIMTGEELTYDYNFAPYSKDPQKCLCGADNCRGVLGPKPRDVKVPKAVALWKDESTRKGSLKATIKAGKRKLQELFSNEEDVYDDVEGASRKLTKKRKISVPTGASSLSKSSLQMAKGAAKALKRSVSSVSLSAKAALSSKASVSSLRRTSTGGMAKTTTKKASPRRPQKSTTTAEEKVITSSKAAVAVALASLGIPPSRKAATTLAQASRSSSASRTIVAKSPAKGPSTSNGNAKTKPKIALKVKTTPTKGTGSAAKKAKKHSGYTPPSSPKGGSAKQALFMSSRKKTPSRKILESTKAGTASGTKPKAFPQAKAKTKLVKKVVDVAKKQRSILSMLKAADSPSSSSPSSTKKAKKTSAASPAPLASIRAVPASPAGANGRPSTPTEQNMDVVLSSPLSALSSVQSTPESSPPPRSATRPGVVTMRVPQIRLIQRNLDDN